MCAGIRDHCTPSGIASGFLCSLLSSYCSPRLAVIYAWVHSIHAEPVLMGNRQSFMPYSPAAKFAADVFSCTSGSTRSAIHPALCVK